MNRRRPGAPSPRGAALIFAMLLVALLAVVAAAVIRYAARDRIDSARMVVQERALTCTEAGLQYGRRYFSNSFVSTNGWDDILGGGTPGRFDPSLGDAVPSKVNDIPIALRGDGDGDGKLDPGTDLDGDGESDFWVSIRDDDDDVDMGNADDRKDNNNFTVILRAECSNRFFAAEVGGQRAVPVLEAYLTYVQGVSDHGKGGAAVDSATAAAGGSATGTGLPDK